MIGAQIAVQEPHGDGLEALQTRHQRLDLGPVERAQHSAPGIHPLPQGEAGIARDQRFGQDEIEVILLEAAFGPHLDDVAEAFRGDESRSRPAPLDQRIGGQCRAMDDPGEGRRRKARLAADTLHPLEDRVLGGSVGGQDLGGVQASARLEHHVREGSADIDAEIDAVRHGEADASGGRAGREGSCRRSRRRTVDARPGRRHRRTQWHGSRLHGYAWCWPWPFSGPDRSRPGSCPVGVRMDPRPSCSARRTGSGWSFSMPRGGRSRPHRITGHKTAMRPGSVPLRR